MLTDRKSGKTVLDRERRETKNKDPDGIGQSTGKARLHAFVLRGFSRDVFGLCDPLHRTDPVVYR